MKTYEIMKCRRQALGFTKEKFAERVDLDVRLIEFYESGKKVASYVEERIRTALYEEFKNMDSMEHYKKRILELALELNKQDDTKFALLEIGHMITELGKLQMAIIDNDKI